MTKRKTPESEGTSELLHALAEPTRQGIVQLLLNEGEQTAAQICSHFSVSNPAISQHLKVLREAGAVDVEKRAQYRLYSVNPAAIAELEEWTAGLRRMWERRIVALGKILDKQNEKMNKEGR